jgi:hypothetical protein
MSKGFFNLSLQRNKSRKTQKIDFYIFTVLTVVNVG